MELELKLIFPQFYIKCHIKIVKLLYVKAGDLQEARAIYNSYCNGRESKLPIGLLKSNIGHGEGACGIASITKVIISYENESIPPNLNLNKLKTEIAVICPPLFPVVETINYTPGIYKS
jgi:acyl transferase domain-containing protein